MPLQTDEYLRHILVETAYVMSDSKRTSKTGFMESETLKRAYVRSLEIMGEAVKHLPGDLREKYSAVDWKGLTGMRDRLVHAYFGVDYDIVWDVVVNEVPILNAEVKQILAKEYSS